MLHEALSSCCFPVLSISLLHSFSFTLARLTNGPFFSPFRSTGMMDVDETAGGTKRHAACDECRRRKLKCSGEMPICSRCIKQDLQCVYSVQKQMGRPRKSQTTSSGNSAVPAALRQDSSTSSVAASPHPSIHIPDLSAGEYIPPDQWISFLSTYMPPPEPPVVPKVPSQSDISNSNSPNTAFQQEFKQPGFETFNGDFSMDFMTSPFPMNNAFAAMTPPSAGSEYNGFQMQATAPNQNVCACLPTLYLTLSTMATLQSEHISPHVIQSLQTAMKTARSAVYCRLCPMNFTTGVQNIMMLGTLLSSLANNWLQLLDTPPYSVWQGFYENLDMGSMPKRYWDESEEPFWRLWIRQMVYRNVFGTSVSFPNSDITGNSDAVELTLASIVDSLERRQQMWHNEIPQTDEFISRRSFGPRVDAIAAMADREVKEKRRQNSQQHGHGHGHGNGHGEQGASDPEHFCIQVAQNTRKIMNNMATVMGLPPQIATP